ncbi:MAG: efflux RND transporter periplasmic adaptor subunit [Gemmatimonadales bacterium]
MHRITAGRIALMTITMALLAAGCHKAAPGAAATALDPVTIGPENVVVIVRDTLRSGPTVSGTLAAEQEAALRAEVGGRIVRVLADPGQPVDKGQLLIQLDDASIRDAWLSARSGVTAAKATDDQAHRDVARDQRLADAGAIAARDLEASQRASLAADAALADAQARLANAQLQLDRTEIRAPFRGLVSERPVNAGDVVQIGTPLVSVVDPVGMRLEAQVPVDQLTAIHLGTPVDFSVNGLGDRQFIGRIDRINPSVDPATRQVRIRVSIPNSGHALVSGLYAQGRVSTVVRIGVSAPVAAVDLTGAAPVVRRLHDGKVEIIEVRLGVRDDLAGRVELLGPIAAGDTLLLGSAQALSAGTPVQVMLPDAGARRQAP